MNLLQETIRAIEESGHTSGQVDWVGSPEFGWFHWEEFERVADVLYDPGFGSAEVATDLIVHFSDGRYLSREEYDGSEWWAYQAPVSKPTTRRTPKSVVGGMWETLSELNDDQ